MIGFQAIKIYEVLIYLLPLRTRNLICILRHQISRKNKELHNFKLLYTRLPVFCIQLYDCRSSSINFINTYLIFAEFRNLFKYILS